MKKRKIKEFILKDELMKQFNTHQYFFSSCCNSSFVGLRYKGKYWIVCSVCGAIDWRLKDYEEDREKELNQFKKQFERRRKG